MDGPTVTADVTLAQLADVFGERGDAARCWCQFFRMTNAEYRLTTQEQRRDRTAADLAAPGPSPGVVALSGGEAVGWCAVAPWGAYPRLATAPSHGSRERDLAPAREAGHLWAITCFVVRVGHRRRGLGSFLLDGAVEHARAHGARVLEGYPVDTAGRRVSAADLYHGPLDLFLAAGFEVVARPAEHRPVVRLTL